MLWESVCVGGGERGCCLETVFSPLSPALRPQSWLNPNPRQRGRVRVRRPSAQVRRRKGRVLGFRSGSTWSTSVCVCVVYLICEEVTGVSCSNPVGCWPLICFPGCHYRHFQNLIPRRTNRLGFTLRAHT